MILKTFELKWSHKHVRPIRPAVPLVVVWANGSLLVGPFMTAQFFSAGRGLIYLFNELIYDLVDCYGHLLLVITSMGLDGRNPTTGHFPKQGFFFYSHTTCGLQYTPRPHLMHQANDPVLEFSFNLNNLILLPPIFFIGSKIGNASISYSIN